MRGAHALLHDGNIVRHPPELNDLVLQIGDRKSGTRIAVTWLPDRTRVQEITARQLNTERCKGFAGARVNLEYLELRILVGKPALVMRVAEESDRCGGVQETVKGLRRCEDVFVFILKRAVDQNHAVRRKRSGGQRR